MKLNNKYNLIIISGSHRSGTTWVGKVIDESNKIKYIHEPFSPRNMRKDSPIKRWYEYIDSDDSEIKQIIFKQYINNFINSPIKHLKDRFHLRQSPITLKSILRFLNSNHIKIGGIPLIKDSMTLMSLEWFQTEYSPKIIICIRHPAAFVASLKIQNWNFDFNNFLNQEKLMNFYLKEFSSEINFYSNNKKDIVDQGILLWRIIHKVILNYQKYHNREWLFIRHEDLSLDPINEFSKIFEYINIPFNVNIKEYIIKNTTNNVLSDYSRNSKKNITTWKERLSLEEILRIKQGTSDLYMKFYSENDWE